VREVGLRAARGAGHRGSVISGLSRSALAIGILVACSTAPAHWQSKSLQPLTIGWQQFFRVQWDASEFQGQPMVEGYITNVWGFRARSIQLLVSGYDGTGALIGQLVSWGPFALGPGGRAYFNVPVPAAPTYEVAIFSWTWVLDDDDEWRRFFLR
jgi:hypothetical protein